MKEVIRYETSDGKLFETKEAAEAHEEVRRLCCFISDRQYMTTMELVKDLLSYYMISERKK